VKCAGTVGALDLEERCVESAGADEKTMKLRYEGTCSLCGRALERSVLAVYESLTTTVRCISCEPIRVPEDDGELPSASSAVADVAGASAQREYERRKTKREERVRAKHPKIGGLILALSGDPQSTKAWASGAKGEAALGARLHRHASQSIAVLHDRRIPGTRANIDHIVVTVGGVFIVDAKRYVNKRPDLRTEGGILRPRVEKLIVGGSDRTKLVDGVLGQVERVRAALANDTIDVAGVLCFIDADWPLVGGAFAIRGVRVVWPKRLSKILDEATGEVDVTAVRDRIAAAFPPA
jgi:hypothetical protein